MRKTLLVVASLTGTIASAQAPSAARLDSLRMASAAALARLKAYDDSIRIMNGRLDSAVVGPIRLRAEPPIMPIATAAARRMIDSLRPSMGNSLDRLSSYNYTFKTNRWTGYRSTRKDSAIVIDVFGPSGPPLMNLRQTFDTALVATSLRLYAPFLVFRDASPSFTAWAANQITLDSLSVEDWRSLRLAMVSSPAAIGRRCFAGDLTACKLALQITPSADPVREWYDEKDRVRIVRANERYANMVDGAAVSRCTGNQDFSCVALLRRYPRGMLPLPVAENARSLLVRYALTLGGEGAVERLLVDRTEPMERVAAAARLPADTVLARWQDRIRHQPASSRDLTPEIAATALFWGLALGALSLRSSRWR